MFTLHEVVPWGRSFDEYRRMFALGDADLARSILGCGDGPASFNAEATRHGHRVTSCDPIYRWPAADIAARVEATFDEVLEQTRRHADRFVWDAIASVDALGRARMAAVSDFLADYGRGRHEGRYVAAGLPRLPFADGAFGLALCSHLLFLYTVQLDEAFHHASIAELCRVAAEVRIFPLLTLAGDRSPFADTAAAFMRARGHQVSIERVPYEFQRGGDEMLRIRR